MRKLTLLAFITGLALGAPLKVFSQQCPATSSVRVACKGGCKVDFIFNTIEKYETGITLTNWTTIDVSFSNTTDATGNPTTATWALLIDTDASNAFTDAMNPANTMDIRYVKVTANCPGATSAGQKPIGNFMGRPLDPLETPCSENPPGNANTYPADNVFITNGPQGNHTITLSYVCEDDPGIPLPSLMTVEPGFYTANIYATVIVDHY